MEPALKQRLMGAAVLVALAIIFLPMVFDGPAPPTPAAGSLPLAVPAAPDRPLQTREIPLTLPARAPAAESTGPAVSAAAPSSLPTVDVPLVPRPRAEPETPAPPVDDAVAPPAPPADPQPAPAAAAPRPEQPAPSAAGSETPVPVVPPAGAGSRFAVNLGSYANAANVAALESSLRKAGVPVYVESITLDGKPARRLRAGPFGSRAAAEAAVAGIRRVTSDVPIAVVALDADEPAPSAPAPAVAGGFVVQVAAMGSEAEANALRDRLRSGGYPAYTERVARDKGALWRVRVGPEIQRSRADLILAEVRQKYQLQGQVLTHP